MSNGTHANAGAGQAQHKAGGSQHHNNYQRAGGSQQPRNAGHAPQQRSNFQRGASPRAAQPGRGGQGRVQGGGARGKH